MRGQENEAETGLARVKFEPDDIEVFVPKGTTIAKAAFAAGCGVEMPCGGMGTCGKCRVHAEGELSEPDSSEKRLLSAEALAEGIRLACRAKIEGDAVVEVPAASRSIVQKILSDGVTRDVHVAPAVQKIYVELPKPTLIDERGEFERLAAGLMMYDIEAQIGVPMARELPKILRAADYRVTAVVSEDWVIAVEPGNTARHNYGVAFDIGSTTIAGYLIDVNTGHELAVTSAMNPQMAYGDDLVSRINFAMTEPRGLGMLRDSLLDALNRVIRQLVENQGVDQSSVYEVTIVGNTCMTHIFLGLDITTLGISPYVPTICEQMTLRGEEAGLEVNPGARVHVLPNVAGFVGSDLVGVVLSVLREDDKRTRLAVDVGTNGEMALQHDGRLYACSAAAGPAFEGARIAYGMRGSVGAIDSVCITDHVEFTTVDDKPALGICGSGVIDAVAGMLDAGVLDESGRMLIPSEAGNLPSDIANRLIDGRDGPEFVIAWAGETARRENITLSQRDVRQLQLAKGSIRAAIETLFKVAETNSSELEDILLAGAFGNYIRKESAVRIGLIPSIDMDKIVPVGNAAGAGAKLALISVRERERARRLASRIEHIELASHSDYENEFMDKMLFPSSADAAVTGR